MSVEDKTFEVLAKITDIETVLAEIKALGTMIRMRREVNGEVVELTSTQKQKLLQAYNQQKTRLQTLIGELP